MRVKLQMPCLCLATLFFLRVSMKICRLNLNSVNRTVKRADKMMFLSWVKKIELNQMPRMKAVQVLKDSWLKSFLEFSGGGAGIDDSVEPLDCYVDPDFPNFQKPIEGDKYDDADLPCEAWWKRHAFSVYAHAKEANTVWSIFLAAAVMGLVIIGHQWQHERWQVLRLRWQFDINDERMSRLLAPISRLKEMAIGGHRRGSLVRGSASSER
ncbi:ATG8-interacting protein 2-like isoform X3 [Salvia hispanica]|uniref:ATG8-interacting protein 2-like isoform X3 n=1 Tax=Salvia hispanica TaxID=49212 RepID=UPI0020093856|nr:ATG8-interacting protein 2-like isoform X3 [Salvia hispanica]